MKTHPGNVPVTLICGTDASGLALTMASDRDCVVASGWNGPGSITIDPDVAHRSPGCGCCAMRIDLIDGLLRAVRRATPPERVLLVAGPDDDVATIVYTLLSDADLGRHIHLDGVVVALDAIASATRLAAEQPLGPAHEVDALAMADALVLARSDQLTADGLDRLRSALREINGVGTMLELGIDGAKQHILREQLLELRAWSGAPVLAQDAHDEQAPFDGHRCEAAQTVVLRSHEPLDADAVDEWFDALIASHATRILRLQGALTVDDEHGRTCCVGVRSYAISWSEACTTGPDEQCESLVVVVGRGLDVEMLSREFAATRAQ